jgi:hypothetical protein
MFLRKATEVPMQKDRKKAPEAQRTFGQTMTALFRVARTQVERTIRQKRKKGKD